MVGILTVPLEGYGHLSGFICTGCSSMDSRPINSQRLLKNVGGEMRPSPMVGLSLRIFVHSHRSHVPFLPCHETPRHRLYRPVSPPQHRPTTPFLWWHLNDRLGDGFPDKKSWYLRLFTFLCAIADQLSSQDSCVQTEGQTEARP